jgi:hypothetical protein
MKHDILTPLPSGNIVTVTGTSAPTTNTMAQIFAANGYTQPPGDFVVEVTSSTAVHWTYGTTPVATDAHPRISAGMTRQFRVGASHKMAFIKQSGASDGTISVHICTE